MIYLKTTSGQHFIVLEPANIEQLKSGIPLHTPTHEILLAYSPDIIWTSEQIKKALEGRTLDVAALEAILEEGLSRPEIKERAYKETEFFSSQKLD